jgi:hypothetical protein
MKVSFDFDSTLSIDTVQDYAQHLRERGYEIWIVTSRFSDDPDSFTEKTPSWIRAFKTPNVNNDLYKVAMSLGIPHSRIIYTEMELKADTLKDMDFLFHLDDDKVEIDEINKITNTDGVLRSNDTPWRLICDEILLTHK